MAAGSVMDQTPGSCLSAARLREMKVLPPSEVARTLKPLIQDGMSGPRTTSETSPSPDRASETDAGGAGVLKIRTLFDISEVPPRQRALTS